MQDTNIDSVIKKLESAGNFGNKIWNAAKFVLMNLEDADENMLNSDISNLKLQVEDKTIYIAFRHLTKITLISIEFITKKNIKLKKIFALKLLNQIL